MKLLFDQNLSFKLCGQLSDLFPNSGHARLLGMAEQMTALSGNSPAPMVTRL
jgi:predicted nuclease of predicted toxin-antitoxin system